LRNFASLPLKPFHAVIEQKDIPRKGDDAHQNDCFQGISVTFDSPAQTTGLRKEPVLDSTKAPALELRAFAWDGGGFRHHEPPSCRCLEPIWLRGVNTSPSQQQPLGVRSNACSFSCNLQNSVLSQNLWVGSKAEAYMGASFRWAWERPLY
jgi:hypothetical protein